MSDRDHSPEPETLSREELHEQVWQTPMIHLAKRYGISGNGLAKICARYDIPVPVQGHWARLAAGHRVEIIPLPKASHEFSERIKIRPTPRTANDIASPRAAAEQRATEISIKVSDRLNKPHRIIAGWLDEHERLKREAQREREYWSQEVLKPADFTQQDRRRHRLLDALFKSLELHGAIVSETERRELVVEVDGQRIEFGLRQKQKQIRRPLTEEEKRWQSWKRDGLKCELQGTGFLVFGIKSYLIGDLKREWLENADKPLETMLPQIVATILIAGPLLEERARLRALEAERFAMEHRRREEERLRQKENQNRIRRLVEISKAWREFEVAREFLLRLEHGDEDPDEVIGDKSIRDWIDWTRQQLDLQDPLLRGARAVFSDISQIKNWTYRD